MKKTILLIFVLLISPSIYKSQHTFSIVAVDPITNEIGSAGATCISSEDGAIDISDIVLGVGAIHTQAWWTPVNQDAARLRMEAGDSPEEIISWLESNDNPSQGGWIGDRQYGVVDLNNGEPRSAAYTGVDNWTENGHRTGPGYSIQGNVLISEDVLNDMEAAYLDTEGPICEKLMAVLQAAKRPGADSRCLEYGISSGSAFIRVAKPTDTNSDYGNLWLDLNVWLEDPLYPGGDPIDVLQVKFDDFKDALGISENEIAGLDVYPNPSTGDIVINAEDTKLSKVELVNALGQVVLLVEVNDPIMKIDISSLSDGTYFMKMYDGDNSILSTKSVVLSRDE